MERTVKLTLLSKRATSLSLTVITALLHLPGRSPAIRSLLRASRRVTDKRRPRCRHKESAIGFFVPRENATNGKRKRRRASSVKESTYKYENRHDREERGIFFFCHALIYIYIYLISAILRGLCTKNKKKVGDAYKNVLT